MIRILADSTCDLSLELKERFEIETIPLHINLDQNEYADGVNISPDEIYAWVEKTGTTPKTSAASIEDMMSCFRAIIEQGDEIIMFTISAEMSTNINVARMASVELGATDKITVIDSRNLSTGIGLLVIEAARMAKEGILSRDEIEKKILEIIPKVRASFVVDTLTYLYKGGRCNAVAALAGGMLKLHPKIVVENGKMDATKKYRGKMSSILMEYTEDMKEDLLHAKPDHVFITHSGYSDEEVNTVKEYLTGLDYFDEIHVTRAGGVISSHCGPGTLGVLFIAG